MMYDKDADRILMNRSMAHRAYRIMEECGTCEGSGKEEVETVRYAAQNYDRFPEPIYGESIEECSECNGTGTVEKEEDDEV